MLFHCNFHRQVIFHGTSRRFLPPPCCYLCFPTCCYHKLCLCLQPCMSLHFYAYVFVLFDGVSFGSSPGVGLCFMVCLMTLNVLADKSPSLVNHCYPLGQGDVVIKVLKQGWRSCILGMRQCDWFLLFLECCSDWC